MSDQLKMFEQTTSKDTHSATGLPESEGGRLHLENLESQTSIPSGQGHVPVSHSLRQGKEREQLTSDTSGPNSTVWSKSADLQESLVSKLQESLERLGSTMYKLTWREKNTPQGWSYSQLVASARRIKDSASIGLPKTSWPTPTQRDHKGGYRNGRIRNGKVSIDTLDVATQLVSPKRLTATGRILIGSTVEMVSGGPLNPNHSRWLMGYPAVWEDCADTVTLSSSRRRKRSSKR